MDLIGERRRQVHSFLCSYRELGYIVILKRWKVRYSQNFLPKALFWFATLLMKFRQSFSDSLFAQSKRHTFMMRHMLSSPILPLLISHFTLSTTGLCKLPAHCFSGIYQTLCSCSWTCSSLCPRDLSLASFWSPLRCGRVWI